MRSLRSAHPFVLVVAAFAVLWAPSHIVLDRATFGAVNGIEISAARIVGVCVLVASLWFILSGRRTVGLPLSLWLLFAFVGAYAVAVARSDDVTAGATDLVRIAAAVLVAVATFYAIREDGETLLLAAAVTLSGFLVALITIAQSLFAHVAPSVGSAIFGDFFRESFDRERGESVVRVVGTLGSANETSSFLIVAIAFALVGLGSAVSRSRKSEAWLWASAIFVMALGVAATLTRSAFAAAVVIVVVWLAQRPAGIAWRGALLFGSVVLAALVVLAVVAAGTTGLGARMWDANPLTSGASFAQGRGEIWRRELALIGGATHLNTVPNPSAEHGTTGWTAYSTNQRPPIRVSTLENASQVGSKSFVITTKSADGTGSGMSAFADPWPVDPGATVYAHAWVRSHVPLEFAGIKIRLLDSEREYLGSVEVPAAYVAHPPLGVWRELWGVVGIPVHAGGASPQFAELEVQGSSRSASWDLSWDGVQLTPVGGERFSTPTYRDGDNGGLWVGEPHASPSAFGDFTLVDLLLGHGAHGSYVRLAWSSPEQSPHNLVLWLLVETGIMGTALYLGALYFWIVAMIRAARGVSGCSRDRRRTWRLPHADGGLLVISLSNSESVRPSGEVPIRRIVGQAAIAFTAAYLLIDFFVVTVNAPAHRLYVGIFIGASLAVATRANPDESNVEAHRP